ncbi:uncharacterized protein EDB93DRAFT_1099694 [Suillus bovinus]|uniref:uncharacterized protein n=1 Tax=Suillus bovinus TaxID=48563 RepID=UPI001B85F5AC|nr:uncharacterized protein EDB93DRAFT_1099694 [Suillus bovinus]KAG2159302.1 hypothetical protein EDB93DRAFT_1099694 [Suillus bovinus]
MSSHSTSASAATTANQALIALVARLTEMVQDVIQLPSQEEKMELSQKIAHEVNDVIRSYGKEASYVSPGLLSLAAEIFRAQRCTTQLVEIPDWTHLGHNKDMRMKHPLYSKALGNAPPIASAASVPALLCIVPTDPGSPSSSQRRSCPDTDTEKVKGKTKAKALEVDGDEDVDFINVNELLDCRAPKIKVQGCHPCKKAGYTEGKPLYDQGSDKNCLSSPRARAPAGKPRSKNRCWAKDVECCPRLMKKGNVALTCSLYHLWKMACIQTNTESPNITPTTNTTPPAAAVTTHSKITQSKATRKKMREKSNAKDKKIWQPSPIQEEDNSIQMLNGTVDVTGAQQQSAPLAFANNFPPNHWIEPNNDELPPPCHILYFGPTPDNVPMLHLDLRA